MIKKRKIAKNNKRRQADESSPLFQVAKKIVGEGRYSGGPLRNFEVVGRDTFVNLLKCGLRPDHKLLDFGCGALRLGYWLIRFLDDENYYAIEPDLIILNAGKKHSIGQKLLQSKKPSFSNNPDSDFSVFNKKFDFVVARSILTHTTPGMTRKMLENFKNNTNPKAIMLASYWPINSKSRGDDEIIGDDLPLDDYRFERAVKYSYEKLREWSSEYGIDVVEYREEPIISQQVWLKFQHKK